MSEGRADGYEDWVVLENAILADLAYLNAAAAFRGFLCNKHPEELCE